MIPMPHFYMTFVVGTKQLHCFWDHTGKNVFYKFSKCCLVQFELIIFLKLISVLLSFLCMRHRNRNNCKAIVLHTSQPPQCFRWLLWSVVGPMVFKLWSYFVAYPSTIFPKVSLFFKNVKVCNFGSLNLTFHDHEPPDKTFARCIRRGDLGG